MIEHSKEGATQGDNLVMAMYALSTRELIDDLKQAAPETVQVWFADDSADAGKLRDIQKWWMRLKEIGPAYGYFPNAPKCWIILKSPELRELAEELFGADGVNITTEGKRHIGAVLGTEEFREEFVKVKVQKWKNDVHELSAIAKEEPQAALCAYNVGLCQRWKFLQRTVEGISHLFQPLEDEINESFIPALCGRAVSDVERRILALPYRYGGLGKSKLFKTCQISFYILIF